MSLNLNSLIATDNQSRGTPTIAGAGENEGGLVTTTNQILDLFGKGADVYNSVTGRVPTPGTGNNANQGTPTPPKTGTQIAEDALKSKLLYIGLGIAALIAVIFISRR